MLTIHISDQRGLGVPPFKCTVSCVAFNKVCHRICIRIEGGARLTSMFVGPRVRPLRIAARVAMRGVSSKVALRRRVHGGNRNTCDPLKRGPIRRAGVRAIFPIRRVHL